MSEQEGRHTPIVYRLTTSDPETWKAYWEAQGQLWRTEPEIDDNRQAYLTECLMSSSKGTKNVFPFSSYVL